MRRKQSRLGNGRFTRNTLENCFGLHCIWCPSCGIGNPYGVTEVKPKNCHNCNAELEKGAISK